MRRMSLSIFVWALLGAPLCVIGVPELLAQGVVSGHRQSVTAVLVDTLPQLRESFAAIIVRGSGASGRDVILLPRRTASGVLLDEATRVLLDSRVRLGDHPVKVHGKSFKRLTLGVRGQPANRSWTAHDIAKAQELVDKLMTAPAREIPLVGKVPAIEFVPPPIRRASGGDSDR